MLRPLLCLCVFMALQGAAGAQTCTLTGPTVIDFQGRLNTVSDLCVYKLVLDADSGLELVASFQERRRRDVSFVDSLVFTVGTNNAFFLQQGGVVLQQLNGQPLTSLNSTAQTYSGVSISKDETGVTAEFSNSNFTLSVFFDGTTAQISLEDLDNSILTGLCVDSTNVPSARLLSSPSGTEQFQDPPDPLIDCPALTTRCELLRDPLLFSCNANIDPTPYIDACSHTLCAYSAADGLRCQFMRAYARACELNGYSVPTRWWRKARCFNKAFCQGKVCADNEFCGRRFIGDDVCLCRAIFAYPYKQAGTLGDPTKCEDNTASLTLFNCLLEERGIDYTLLHLNDPTCTGALNVPTDTVTFSFGSSDLCGAEISSIGSEINYTNAIVSQNISGVITRQDQVYIQFSCYRPQPELKSVAFKIKDSSYVKPVKSGEWTYTVTMKAYTDDKCSKVVATETDVKLDQEVWVELKTHGLDAETIAVVTQSCWATSTSDPNSTLRYNLIIDGCANAADGTVRVRGNGEGTSNRFSFNMFEFTRSPNNVYLHCQLQLCLKENHSCVPVCPKRRRRFVRTGYHQGEAAFISMGWGK